MSIQESTVETPLHAISPYLEISPKTTTTECQFNWILEIFVGAIQTDTRFSPPDGHIQLFSYETIRHDHSHTPRVQNEQGTSKETRPLKNLGSQG